MSNFSRSSRNRRRIGSQSYIVRVPHSCYWTVFSCLHRVSAFVMAMVIARTVDHRKTLMPEVGFWRWEADVRASRTLRELICADLGDRGVSLSPPNRWGNWNSGKIKKTGYLSQATPSVRSWAKMWKTLTRSPRQGTYWGSSCFRADGE